MSDPIAPIEPPVLTAEDVTKKAQEIADSKIEDLKFSLVKSLGGVEDEQWLGGKPADWNQVKDGVAQEARTIAQEEARKALDQERKANEDKTKQSQEQEQATKDAQWAQMTKEWNEAVEDGVLPPIAPEIKEKLTHGKRTKDLTDEERNDPGLKAYQEVSTLHMQMAREGKSSSLYRTAKQFYKQEPAGARAPVMGAAPAGGGSSGELKYSDVAANRRKIFKF